MVSVVTKAVSLSNKESGNSLYNLSEKLSIAYTKIEKLKARLASLEDVNTFSETVSLVSNRLTNVLKTFV
jgi:hypothetical protein